MDDQQREDSPTRPARSERERRKRIFVGVLTAVLVVAALCATYVGMRIWASARLVEVSRQAQTCLDDMRRSGEGDPHTCADISARVTVVRDIPGFVERVDRLEADLRFRAAVQALELATSARPDADDRLIAASEVMALGLDARKPGRPAYCRSDSAHRQVGPAECRDSFTILADAGAWSVLLAFQSELETGRQWRALIEAAQVLAEIDTVRDLVSTESVGRLSYGSLSQRSENERIAGLYFPFIR